MQKTLILKDEINGFDDVRETVKVVEKDAAARIHLLKTRVAVLRDYKNALQAQLARLFVFQAIKDLPLLREPAAGDRAVLLVGGDRGLVGGLYHDLVNVLLAKEKEYKRVLVLGGKVNEYLAEEGITAERLAPDAGELLQADEIATLGASIMSRFLSEEFRSVDIIYPSFISLSEQRPALVRFLPFALAARTVPANATSTAPVADGFPIFEPSPAKIFGALMAKYINVFFIEIGLEAKLSEFAARTVTTEHAASKTQDIVRFLQMSLLRERRNTITQKQLERFIAHQTS